MKELTTSARMLRIFDAPDAVSRGIKANVNNAVEILRTKMEICRFLRTRGK